MKNFNKARSQGGFSLIELLLVLAIIAALAVAAFIVYPRVQAGRNASYEAQVLSSAQAGVKALFTTNNYFNLNNNVAWDAEIFPANMKMGTAGEIKNQWDGDVTVAPAQRDGSTATTAPARYFKITYQDVPTDVCIRLAGAAVNNFGGVFIDSGNTGALGDRAQNTYSTVAAEQVLDESVISTGCQGGGNGVASLTFLSN